MTVNLSTLKLIQNKDNGAAIFWLLTSGTTTSIEAENGLYSNIHGGSIESLEHNLGHLLSVSLWVQVCLSEKNRMLLRGNSELIVKCVVPDRQIFSMSSQLFTIPCSIGYFRVSMCPSGPYRPSNRYDVDSPQCLGTKLMGHHPQQTQPDSDRWIH